MMNISVGFIIVVSDNSDDVDDIDNNNNNNNNDDNLMQTSKLLSCRDGYDSLDNNDWSANGSNKENDPNGEPPL